MVSGTAVTRASTARALSARLRAGASILTGASANASGAVLLRSW
jgi:hypothetical protein